MGLINEARSYGGDLRKVIEAIVDKSGLIAALQAENTDEARGRVENIQEFLGVVDEFSDTHEDEEAMFEAPTAGGAELADEEAAAAASAAAIPASADAPAGSFYAFAGAADNQVSSPAEQKRREPRARSAGGFARRLHRVGCACVPTSTRLPKTAMRSRS